MRLKEVFEKTVAFFKEKKVIHTPRLDAELIISYALNCSRMDIYLKYDQPLTESEVNKCRELVMRRSQGEPLAYICGEKEFFGFPFNVNKSVLIPRPETEHIIEKAEEWVNNLSLNVLNIQINPMEIHILDLGTGSGCIAISLAKRIPNARILGVDISNEAINLARENAEINGVSDRVSFIQADASNTREMSQFILNFFKGKIDILVSNPPYISIDDLRVEASVKKYEPHEALFAKNEGLFFLLEWSAGYVDYLNKHSICLFEFGCGQSLKLKKHFENLGVFEKIEILKDLSGKDRIICGEKNG